MSMVHPELTGARVLDLFAGSGALGLEALSRGAANAVFVDVSPAAVAAILENGRALGALGEMRVHRGDALRFVRKVEPMAFDVAFADPPYGSGMASRLAQEWLRHPFARVLGIEHAAQEHLPEGGVTRFYGDTAVTIYRYQDPAPSPKNTREAARRE
jgi:16S rRNA (guanine966-N2)-methyltransferase